MKEKVAAMPNQKLEVTEKCQEDPKFIIAIAVPQYVLSFLKPLTCFLQKTNYDMVVAFDQA